MTKPKAVAKGPVGETQIVAIERLHPNPWNPNKMDDRTYEAERESIRLYGFIDPVTVRPHPEIDGDFQIIDGEHRVRAASEEGYTEVSIQVVDLDDAQAKKLTIILNETRGNADVVLLGKLLTDLDASAADAEELLRGLPYTQNELDHFLALGREDWDRFTAGGGGDPPPPLDTRPFIIELPAEQHEQLAAHLDIIVRELGLKDEAAAVVEAAKRLALELNQTPAAS